MFFSAGFRRKGAERNMLSEITLWSSAQRAAQLPSWTSATCLPLSMLPLLADASSESAAAYC
jgi:hypothetical protein